MNTYYVYGYFDNNLMPYYIGKGKAKRAWSKHKNINLPENKDNIIILKENLLEIEALQYETFLISLFGRKNNDTGILINKTPGGYGAGSYKHTEEAKRKISESHKGRKHTEQSKRNMSNGQKGKIYSDEARKNMSNGQKGYKKTDEHIQKIIDANTGQKRTEEQRLKCATYGMKDKKHSEETKEKMRIAAKGRKFENVICPHCGTIGAGGNMTRYHFDNCKHLKID